MGSNADLIIARSSDVPAILASEYPLSTFKGANADGLDPLKIAALHSLVAAKDFSDLLEFYQPVGEAAASGPWLIKFPEELIALLADLAPQDHASISAKWASTEQIQKEGWSEQDTEQFFARLVHFSQAASFEGKDVFLWIYN